MKLLQKLLWLGIALLITSCASTKPPLPEVSIPPKRILQNGYSLVPLNEKGWHIAGGNAYQLALAKFGENPDETFTVQAMPFSLFTYKTNEEFVRLVKEGQAKDTSPPRYKILKHEVTTYPMNGTDCAKSHMVTEDHAAVKRSGKSGDMIHEMLTLTCALPSAKYVGISIIYSQRNYPGYGDPAFAEKAASILNSVEFTEPQKIDSTSPLGKFNVLCSDILAQSPNKQPAQLSPQPIDAKQATEPNAINKLASIGISVGRTGSINTQGIYALFERDQNDDYSLIAVQPSSIQTTNLDIQEVLFISPKLDHIGPAFASFDFSESHQAFQCTARQQNNDSSFRPYEPCSSSLTKASNVAAGLAQNALIAIPLLAFGFMPTTFASYVDTDKEMVAGLVVNSKLFQCLKVANQNGLKAEAAATVAKEISLANAPELKELNGGDCSENGLKVSAETYYQRGKALVALNEYKAAMACLMRAQNEEKDTVVYRDACTQIATMYELGWGVDKDIETSKSWLNKAGL